MLFLSQGLIQLIMCQNSSEAHHVAKDMIKQIMGEFTKEVSSKDALRKLPSKVQQGAQRISQEIMCSSYVRNQNLEYEREVSEDKMPIYFQRDSGIKGSVPVVNKTTLIKECTQSIHYRRSSSGLSAPNKEIKLDVDSINPNRVMNLLNRNQQTAKSYRSVVELEDHISHLRKTYLKSLKQKQRQNKSCLEEPAKIIKIPKLFTHDFDFSLLESRPKSKKGIVRSPLRVKQIGEASISNKSHPQVENMIQSPNIEDELARKSTALPERQKRVYDNLNKRQVSHFPFIQLVDNARLTESDFSIQGPQSRTSYLWKEKSKFVSHLGEETAASKVELFTQNAEDLTFPTTLNLTKRNSFQEGMILKNSRYFKSTASSRHRDFSMDFRPVNSPRKHVIDQYYRLKPKPQ